MCNRAGIGADRKASRPCHTEESKATKSLAKYGFSYVGCQFFNRLIGAREVREGTGVQSRLSEQQQTFDEWKRDASHRLLHRALTTSSPSSLGISAAP